MPYRPGLGEHVHRDAREVNLQANYDLFLITGGAILMTYLIGRVEHVIGAGAGGDLLLQFDEVPAIFPVGFCTASVIASDPVDTLYICDGEPTNPLIVVVASGGGAGHAVQGGWLGGDMAVATDLVANGWLLGAGVIQAVIGSANLGVDGTISWELFYTPLEEGVVVAPEYP